jgi:hypothetical protein
MRIGQTVFDSQIEQAVLAVAGVVAIEAYTFATGAPPQPDPRSVHIPEAEGSYYTLAALHLSPRVDPHG